MKPSQPVWNTSNGHSPITLFAQSIYPLSAVAKKYIDAHTFSIKLSKGDYLVKQGEYCRHIYLISKGVLRSYFRDGKKDITTWITAEQEMVTSIRGFELQEPCRENIQAIEDCELIGAEYKHLQHLYENFPEMNIIGRKVYEQYYRDAEERAYISRLSKAVDKYRHFTQTKGHLINRIPLKYVASFLGMTVETLSRIRTKVSREQPS